MKATVSRAKVADSAWSVSWTQEKKETRKCKCPLCHRTSTYDKDGVTPIPWCRKCLEKAFRKLQIPRMKDAGPIKKNK